MLWLISSKNYSMHECLNWCHSSWQVLVTEAKTFVKNLIHKWHKKITARNECGSAYDQIWWLYVGCALNFSMAFTNQACGDVKLIHCWFMVICSVLEELSHVFNANPAMKEMCFVLAFQFIDTVSLLSSSVPCGLCALRWSQNLRNIIYKTERGQFCS